MKGIVVFYIDVGTLPPERADEVIQKIKDEHKEVLEGIKQADYGYMFLPTRPQSATRVEVTPPFDR